ncbi:VOC family protein, partial [Pseudomonas aeruginosa]
GVTLLDQPFDHGDGARSFHLLDPAGNKVQPLYHPAVSGQRLA